MMGFQACRFGGIISCISPNYVQAALRCGMAWYWLSTCRPFQKTCVIIYVTVCGDVMLCKTAVMASVYSIKRCHWQKDDTVQFTIACAAAKVRYVGRKTGH
jgi:hypothetical protein